MPDLPDLSELEWQTRKKRIDPRLKECGWTPTKLEPALPLSVRPCQAIEEYPTDNGPADYALCLEGKLLGIVEAKKVTIGPQNVLTQAERYSRGASMNPLKYGDYRVPFLYATNGEILWFHDVRDPLNLSRKLSRFHTPDALHEMLGRDFETACEKAAATPNDHPKLRPYQQAANAAVEQAIAERKRQMLVAMATGTGKTLMTVNLIHRLMASGVARRILFLVDRKALAAQAVRAFASFEVQPGRKFDQMFEVYSQSLPRDADDDDAPFNPNVLPPNYLTDPKPGHAFVYVCTIQRMAMNLFGRDAVLSSLPDVDGSNSDEADADRLDVPIHTFDLIVADECHRGYTTAEASLWRNTLDHFDAVKVGLTATPAAHTKAYFNEVVYRYEYERAVREGYLVDYDVVKIESNVRLNGVFLQEGEQVSLIDRTTGSETLDILEDERTFDSSEIEAKITVPDSNRKILEEIKTYALEHEAKCGRFPKTLIFACNDLPHTSHADQLVQIAREVFGRGDSFVAKITGRVDKPLQRIREFRNRKEPGIVVTVDLLTTGVDIPDLEYIVFLRPVKSRILFEQMLGRGTRKGERHPDKSHFTVFDCFGGTLIEYFKKATGITAEPPDKPSRTIRQIIEDIYQNRDRAYNTGCLVKRLQRIDKEMSGKAREMFAVYLPDGDVAKYAMALPRLLRDEFTATMTLLRKPEFQDLLEHYPRPEKVFLVAPEAEDVVTSDWLVRGADGREYKPDDYLTAFAAYVQAQAPEVEALSVLLHRPQDWGTDTLSELRRMLLAAPQRFEESQLQKAHAVRYHKALADIISMVKHAANEAEPLYTAEERVQLAFQKITAGKTFTDEQQAWLQRIREHMVTNLTVEPDDFDLMPGLNRFGGWGRADRAFSGSLNPLLKEINAAIAA